MSFGRMNTVIEITSTETTYVPGQGNTTVTVVVATVHAYREGRHGSETWANRATYSTATDLFRFRVIPNKTITTSMKITCEGKSYDIISVENVRGRGMYIELLGKTTDFST